MRLRVAFTSGLTWGYARRFKRLGGVELTREECPPPLNARITAVAVGNYVVIVATWITPRGESVGCTISAWRFRDPEAAARAARSAARPRQAGGAVKKGSGGRLPAP